VIEITWFKVDDGYAEHPKTLEISLAASGLWVRCGAWASKYGTDGFIPQKTVWRNCEGSSGNPKTIAKKLVKELCASGFWEEVDSGFRIHDFLDFNFSNADIQRKREESNARVTALRERRKRERNSVTRDVKEDSVTPLPNPNPNPNTSNDVLDAGEENHPEDDASSKPSKRRTSKTLIPDDWHPSEHHVQTAGERGIDLATEAEKFKAYAESNAKRYANWDQAFNNWLLNASNFNKPQQQGYRNKAQERYEQNMQRARNAQITRQAQQPQLTGRKTDNDFGF
jgi:hypothetical protein